MSDPTWPQQTPGEQPEEGTAAEQAPLASSSSGDDYWSRPEQPVDDPADSSAADDLTPAPEPTEAPDQQANPFELDEFELDEQPGTPATDQPPAATPYPPVAPPYPPVAPPYPPVAPPYPPVAPPQPTAGYRPTEYPQPGPGPGTSYPPTEDFFHQPPTQAQPGGYTSLPYPAQSAYPIPYPAAPAASPYATWGKRAQASLIDILVPWVVISSVIGGLTGIEADGTTLLEALAIWGSIGVLWGATSGNTGQTPGRKWANTKLVGEDGQPIGFGLTIAHYVLHYLDAVVCALGFLWPLWDAKRQTFSDKILKTYVIDLSSPVITGPTTGGYPQPFTQQPYPQQPYPQQPYPQPGPEQPWTPQPPSGQYPPPAEGTTPQYPQR